MCVEYHVFMQEWTHLIGEKYNAKEANEQNPYAVVIVKITAGCTENQGSWSQANQQHVIYFFSEVEISNVE